MDEIVVRFSHLHFCCFRIQALASIRTYSYMEEWIHVNLCTILNNFLNTRKIPSQNQSTCIHVLATSRSLKCNFFPMSWNIYFYSSIYCQLDNLTSVFFSIVWLILKISLRKASIEFKTCFVDMYSREFCQAE